MQPEALNSAAEAMGAKPMQVALAWLLQRAANVLLIPGTSSRAHLTENLAAAGLRIPPEILAGLDSINAPGRG